MPPQLRPDDELQSYTEQLQHVVGVVWDTFLRWVEDTWEPGHHWAMVGPTGEGKTTFAVGVLNTRKWVMALDPKGEDETLSASGYIRVTGFPLPRKLRKDIEEGRPCRIIVGGDSSTEALEKILRELMREAIEVVRGQGGWTIYADEFQILADLRMFGLGKPVEKLLVSARRKRTSVVTAFQAPAWVPKASTRQAWAVAMWGTRDINMIKAVAESMGRDWRVLKEIVWNLPPYFVAVIPKSIRAPIIITHPPKIY